jgi:alpha-beta hydrolase superfamily lysophospholipase
VIVPDQRGRGKSVTTEWKKGDIHSIKRMVQDVAELRESKEHELNGLPVFLGGISFGAVIAVLSAASQNHIKGVIVAGPPFGQHTSPIVMAMEGLVAAINPDSLVGRTPDPKDLYQSKKVQMQVAKDPLFNANPLRAQAAIEIVRTMKNLDRAIQRANTPLLIIYGNMDKLVTPKQISVLKEKWGNKDCSVHLLKGIGHDVFNDDGKEKAFEILDKWMKERSRTF